MNVAVQGTKALRHEGTECNLPLRTSVVEAMNHA
jgi:hypothetical protein